ncbi:MAG TPA: hypothetical protein PLW68_07670 [Casimicrobiaceae bacterium]|nr:hypothetical protein [Casimicrobiaceae bacterium]
MIEYRFRQLAVAGIAAAVLAVATLVVGGPAVAGGGQGIAANVNPGVIPNRGNQYPDLAAKWWQWAYSFPAADVPFLNTGGPVDASANQSGHVWFLSGANLGPTTRSATLPAGVQLFFPMANFVNDYPCPEPPPFQPAPGESLEHFLTRTGVPFLQYMTNLFAEVDGVKLRNLDAYLAISPIFTFTADPALAATVDPCITGTPQPGVSMGYWLLLTPLPPGEHVVRFGSEGWGQDVTYNLNVTPGHR